MSTLKQQIDSKLAEFEELVERLEPELMTEASYGDIDWKPFRSFLSQALLEIAVEAMKSVEVEKKPDIKARIHTLTLMERNTGFNQAIDVLESKKSQLIGELGGER